MIIYGPVPSRRLGQSIGINNIPPKTCSYSCIYCQLTFPTAENSIKRSSRESLVNAVEIIRSMSGAHVECITGDEKEEGFFFSEDIVNDLLSITSVHPIRKEIVDEMLKKRNVDKAVIDNLIKQNIIIEFLHEGKKFYRRNIRNI